MVIIIVITTKENTSDLMVAGILGSVFTGIAGIVASITLVTSIIVSIIWCLNPIMSVICLARWNVIFYIILAASCIPGGAIGLLMYFLYRTTPMVGFAIACLVLGIIQSAGFIVWVMCMLAACFITEPEEEKDEHGRFRRISGEKTCCCCCQSSNDGVFVRS